MPSDRGHKIRTPIDKGSKIRRFLLPILSPDSVSPARHKNRHIAASSTIPVRNNAKYDPISADDKRQKDEKRHLQLSKDYKIHQLRELVIPIPGALGDGSSNLDDL